MNKKAKRRLVVVGGIVVVAMLVIVAIAGSGGAASSLSISDIISGEYRGKKVQVSGSVVADSLSSEGSTASFEIQPEEDADGFSSSSDTLIVHYDGALPATFGTGVVAICTGTVESDCSLSCSELVTKCPSKYESAEGSLTVKGLLDQADSLVGDKTKVCGYVRGDVLAVDAPEGYRFVLESQGETIHVIWDGGMDESVGDGTALVVSGSLNADGTFTASDQPAIDEAVRA